MRVGQLSVRAASAIAVVQNSFMLSRPTRDDASIDEMVATICRTQPGLPSDLVDELPNLVRLAVTFDPDLALWTDDTVYEFLLWFVPRNAIIRQVRLNAAFDGVISFLRAFPRLDRMAGAPETRRLVAAAEELRDRWPLALAVEGRWNTTKRLLGAEALEQTPATIAAAQARMQRATSRHNASSAPERARRLGPTLTTLGTFASHEYPRVGPLEASDTEHALEQAPMTRQLAVLLTHFSTSRKLTPTGLLRLVDVRTIAQALDDESLLHHSDLDMPVSALRRLLEPTSTLLQAAELHGYIRRDNGQIATTPRGSYALKDPSRDFEQLLQLLLAAAAGRFGDDDFGVWSWQSLLLDLLEADAPMLVRDVLAVSGLRSRASLDATSGYLRDLELQRAWRFMLLTLRDVGLLEISPLEVMGVFWRRQPSEQLLYRADVSVVLTSYGRVWAHDFGRRVGVIGP